MARSGTARSIDSERATLSIKSRRTDTLRRAVREDDQRTLILDVTGAKEANKAIGSAQDAPRERSAIPTATTATKELAYQSSGL